MLNISINWNSKKVGFPFFQANLTFPCPVHYRKDSNDHDIDLSSIITRKLVINTQAPVSMCVCVSSFNPNL